MVLLSKRWPWLFITSSLSCIFFSILGCKIFHKKEIITYLRLLGCFVVVEKRGHYIVQQIFFFHNHTTRWRHCRCRWFNNCCSFDWMSFVMRTWSWIFVVSAWLFNQMLMMLWFVILNMVIVVVRFVIDRWRCCCGGGGQINHLMILVFVALMMMVFLRRRYSVMITVAKVCKIPCKITKRKSPLLWSNR